MKNCKQSSGQEDQPWSSSPSTESTSLLLDLRLTEPQKMQWSKNPEIPPSACWPPPQLFSNRKFFVNFDEKHQQPSGHDSKQPPHTSLNVCPSRPSSERSTPRTFKPLPDVHPHYPFECLQEFFSRARSSCRSIGSNS